MEDLLKIGIGIVVLTYVYYANHTKVPLIASSWRARDTILKIVQEEIRTKPGQKLKIYDLGSGLGGLCLALAKAFPDVEVVGLEMAWPAWLVAAIRKTVSRQKNLHFGLKDFWKHDIGDGDIVFCYLGDNLMPRVEEKLRWEPRPDRLIISNSFSLPADWKPVQSVKINGLFSREILVYRQV